LVENVETGTIDNTGIDITQNRMSGNALGINVGGGPFRPNPKGSPPPGPNNFQPYPVLFSVSVQCGRVKVVGRLSAPGGKSYRIDLYSQLRELAGPTDGEKTSSDPIGYRSAS